MAQHSCCNKQMVKRGLWSPEEDEKLIKYITTYGHGCWSSVPKFAGLQRCGKSCRLRWINYLRPDLKRGSFTRREAAIVIELHRILGNRWAQISKHLPGRTDNEVKNFWNSSIKKKFIAHHCSSNMVSPASPDVQNPCSENLYTMNAVPNPNPNSEMDPLLILSPPLILQGFDYTEKLAPLPPSSFSIPQDSAVCHYQPFSWPMASNIQTYDQNQNKVPNYHMFSTSSESPAPVVLVNQDKFFSPDDILQAYLQENMIPMSGDPLFPGNDQCAAAAPPHHIDYVESLMVAFTSSDDLLPPLPCSGPFHVSPSLSCWDELSHIIYY